MIDRLPTAQAIHLGSKPTCPRWPGSLRRFLSEASLWPPGPAWQRHNADLAKLRRYAQWFGGSRDITTNMTANGATDLATDGGMNELALETFVEATQRAQATGIQILVEPVRRRKGRTGGLAVWQWNDPWPAISWSVIDAFGQPKQVYETLQRIYQPVLVSLEYPLRAYRPGSVLCDTLWVVNDRMEMLQDCHLTAWFDDEPVYERDCTLSAGAAEPVGALAVTLPAGFATLRLALYHRNTLLASNVYDLRFHDGGPQRFDQALRRRLVDAIPG